LSSLFVEASAPAELYRLSLHAALPIYSHGGRIGGYLPGPYLDAVPLRVYALGCGESLPLRFSGKARRDLPLRPAADTSLLVGTGGGAWRPVRHTRPSATSGLR